MTWYANRVYINATPAVLERLGRESALDGHIFLLTGALPASWRPDSGEVRLPASGLVVVKEIGAPEDPAEVMDPQRLHSWYRKDEFLSWDVLHGPPDIDVLEGAHIHDLVREAPPAPFLRYLKALHAATGAPVTYYLGATWGGDIEREYAWVFDGREVVYAFTSDTSTIELDAHGRRERSEGVLPLALAHHGIQLPSPYFVPHRTTFDWARYRLSK